MYNKFSIIILHTFQKDKNLNPTKYEIFQDGNYYARHFLTSIRKSSLIVSSLHHQEEINKSNNGWRYLTFITMQGRKYSTTLLPCIPDPNLRRGSSNLRCIKRWLCYATKDYMIVMNIDAHFPLSCKSWSETETGETNIQVLG